MSKFKSICYIGILLIAISCKKKSRETISPTPIINPTMNYVDLTGKTLGLGQSVSLDLDGDQKSDIYFYTQSVADNLNNLVKDQFIAGSRIAFNLNYSENAAGEDMLAGLTAGQDIKSNTKTETWFNVGEAVIMQNVQNTATNKLYWEGNWADKGHLYLPLQQMKGGKIYYGWIELEANTQQQKLILYRAAISKEAEVSVRVGA